MRWKELSEAPIADFGVFGDTEAEGSFRSQDLKAMNNPKWTAKVLRMFERCPVDFNVYLYNAPQGKATLASNKNAEHEFRDISTRNQWMGVKPFMDVMKLTGKLPPNRDKSITVVLTQNEGDERIALTPWMVGHRLAHSLTEPTTISHSWGTNNNTARLISSVQGMIRNVATLIFDSSKEKREELRAIGMSAAWRHDPKAQLEMCGEIFKFKSAREHKIERPTEVVVDVLVQYMVRGRVTFNRVPLEGGVKYSEPVISKEDMPWFKIANERFGAGYNSLLYRDASSFKAAIERREERKLVPLRASWVVLDTQGYGVASASTEERAREIASQSTTHTVKHLVPTPRQIASQERLRKRVENAAILWTDWQSEGWLLTPEQRQTNADKLDAELTRSEEVINAICDDLLAAFIGKAIIF